MGRILPPDATNMHSPFTSKSQTSFPGLCSATGTAKVHGAANRLIVQTREYLIRVESTLPQALQSKNFRSSLSGQSFGSQTLNV